MTSIYPKPCHTGERCGQEIFESAELDNQIKQIEDELTIKLPPLGGAQAAESPHKNRPAGRASGAAAQAAVRRGQGQARGAGKPKQRR